MRHGNAEANRRELELGLSLSLRILSLHRVVDWLRVTRLQISCVSDDGTRTPLLKNRAA
jgi:hypothetical protein